MIYKFEKDDKKIEFEEGKIYYITDRFPTDVRGKQYLWPIIIKCICIETDPNNWDYNFQLKGLENLIPSDIPADQYHHPSDIDPLDWDEYFQFSLKEAYEKFYKEYKYNPVEFFNLLFEKVQR